ncbi:DUF4352 domain-containing protein [Listeria booriae]|uniref:DUF4352 domain-containing protein n=1 Tax=Listeria booriae TaxID=1552123 RepID=A0A7X1CYB6_9LIST|nr:DUF4352 domain-containing protein [Listeria booriae]MBC2022417.1 DUF4352 domain-containing protein [Listeria booriae]MBC2080802.1 DUF4352 domain-containing protein [Listeria booriae]MBC2116091.1 DUF4352 domain-containing protein [Listeria booriae]MBC2324901.1 DUF4352 domain-containing protein [Listeria booriae]MCD2208546.1 DUF4352 domain-containing protein [Listeria booriae]
MKKWLIATTVIATLLVAGACGNTNNKTTETKQPATNHITKTVNNIDMKIGTIKTTESTKKDINMVSIDISLLNNDNAPVGVGAIDFKIKAGSKTYTVYPQGNNFGDEFKPNETLKGKAYYELPNTIKEGTLVYQPETKEEASWQIQIPAAK